MAIVEGIINPMSVPVKTEEGFTVSVINGRQARAVKDRQNSTVAELRSLMARCTKGSLQWRRYNRALEPAQAKAAASLRNIDHQGSRKVAQIAQANDTGQIAIGDVREIEKNSRRAERRGDDAFRGVSGRRYRAANGGVLAARKWRVQFMRLGWEPPYPFGKSEEVVIAASRREAIEIVRGSGVVSPGYKVRASPIKALEKRN